MDADNPNEVLQELDNLIVRTERGLSISASDLRSFREKVSESLSAREATGPQPRTLAQARGLAMAHLRDADESPTGVEAVKA